MIPRSFSTTIEASGKEEFRNLLIVGYASSGKSTLSNVLCATDEFEESECSARSIRNFQKKIFKWNGTTYRLIDIGFSSIKKILCNKTEILQLIPEGISQVLFVVDGRFKEKEIETFEFFEKTIFESGIIEYTTIVRTKFCNFKNKNKCEEDKKQMCEESKTIAKIVESCSIIHVDNPPTNIIVNDDDDRERIVYNKKLRERSRTLLLSHLGFVCQNKYYGHNYVFKCMYFFLYLLLFI
jgi:predicted GTPase